MEPIEINAGAWYLRAPRQDELIDDRPALAALGETEPDYVTRCNALWLSDRSYTWAICEPTTGEMLAEVTLYPASGQIRLRACPGHDAAAQAAGDAVRRFADTLT
ncbi:hypothetical protein [Mycobacterium sp. MMS18-G62]